MKGNHKYKDSVFTLLFQDKEKLIELYNAIEGTNYPKDTAIEINTLENVLYMDRENDISFLLDGRFIVLVEHQSTINENMPLRFRLYLGRVYEKIIESKAIYKERQVKIPTPEFIVLYNGDAKYPKETILRLSDAFLEPQTLEALELVVKVININYEKSAEVLEKSKVLKDYSYFIHQTKNYRKHGFEIGESIELAIKDCLNQDKLREFLEENGSEVMNMLLTEFNLEDAKEVWREEAEAIGWEKGQQAGEQQGRQKGEKIGKLQVAASLLELLDLETIAAKTGLSLEELIQLRDNKK